MQNLNQLLPGRLLKKARYLQSLNLHLQTSLPPEFLDHAWVVNYEPPILTIGVDSSAWRYKLEHYTREIRKHFNQQGFPTKQVNSRIILPSIRPVRKPSPRKPLSASAADSLNSLADVEKNDTLKAALKRLASRQSPAE